MKQFAIFKNKKQIGFPFNSFNNALLMFNSIKELITNESDYQINNIDDHTIFVVATSSTNKYSFNNSSVIKDNNNNFILTIKSL